MGTEDWLDPKCAAIPRAFDIEDFPGYSYSLMRCGACDAQFTGVFKTTVKKIHCPKCHEVGEVTLVREIRKIYLQ